MYRIRISNALMAAPLVLGLEPRRWFQRGRPFAVDGEGRRSARLATLIEVRVEPGGTVRVLNAVCRRRGRGVPWRSGVGEGSDAPKSRAMAGACASSMQAGVTGDTYDARHAAAAESCRTRADGHAQASETASHGHGAKVWAQRGPQKGWDGVQ